MFGGRESIFKFSHTKLRKKFQNPDLHPDSTRESLHRCRWVFEGGQRILGAKEPQRACTAMALCNPLEEDVRLRLGASAGTFNAASHYKRVFGLCGGEVLGLVVVSRFLNFPILN